MEGIICAPHLRVSTDMNLSESDICVIRLILYQLKILIVGKKAEITSIVPSNFTARFSVRNSWSKSGLQHVGNTFCWAGESKKQLCWEVPSAREGSRKKWGRKLILSRDEEIPSLLSAGRHVYRASFSQASLKESNSSEKSLQEYFLCSPRHNTSIILDTEAITPSVGALTNRAWFSARTQEELKDDIIVY